ncbi:Ubiquitin carboxyl-terminal hydrolase 7 [Orchesella cincta]|uniref:Ubiquitin carboxyl-terminal hydrolase 7 n=1 Tax=Orchesella cincta TaxID=48709 RepID=A0A1D2MQK6_ORCCI|nr:Ubiquitin carboxyl-terminal hydrolase 7 [Orchesella cincta]
MLGIRNACGSIERERNYSVGTIRMKVKNISRLEGQVVSDTLYLRNLPWRVWVMPNSEAGDDQNESLAVFIHCGGDERSPKWECEAVAIVRVLSQKIGVEKLFCGENWHMFHPKQQDVCGAYVRWTQSLANRIGDYVKNDFIEIEVFISTEAPSGLIRDTANDIQALDHLDSDVATPEVGLDIPIEFTQCPICYELPRKEVYQCMNGHIICHLCKPNVNACPQCTVKFEVATDISRNRALETVLDNVAMECCFKEKGCSIKVLRKRLCNHERICPFRN